jgi:hypothetical protein
MATKAFLEKAYLAYFGRPVDSTGLTDYASSTDAQVADAFAASAESKALYGSTFNYAQINAIYLALFNREAEKAGLEYWYAKVADKTFTPAGAAIAILNGALNADKIAVENKLAASAAFTAALDTAPEMIGYSGDAAAASARSFLSTITATAATAAAVDAAIVSVVAARTAVPAQTFTLTTGVDTFTGSSGNDTFHAPAGTLGPLDSINGGTGIDTLSFALTAAHAAGASVTGIEKLLINQTTTGGFSASGMTGLTDITTSASTVDVGVTALASAANITVQNQDTALTVTYADSAVSGAADSVKLTLNNVAQAAGTAIALNNTTVTTGTTGIETLTVDLAGNAGGSLAANTTTINTNATASLTKVVITGASAGNLTVGTNITTTALTIDGSAATGNVTLAGIGAVTSNITMGTGNDSVDMGGNLSSADTVNGGAGADTLATTAANMNTITTAGAVLANTTNFETLRITDNAAANATINAALVGAVNLRLATQDTQTIIINNLGGTTGTSNIRFDAAVDTLTLNLQDATLPGSANVVNLDVRGTSATHTFTMEGVETVNINASNAVTAVTMAMTDAALTSLTVTNAGAATFATGTLGANVNTVNLAAVTGGGATTVTLATTANTGANVTGTAGVDTVTGSNQLDVINTFAGNDVIIQTLGNDRINVGSGTDNFRTVDLGDNNTAITITSGTTIDTVAENFDILTGMGVNDLIRLAVNFDSIDADATAGNTDAQGGVLFNNTFADQSATLVRGSYSSSTGLFTISASGADSLFVVDVDGAAGTADYSGIVLVGYATSATAATLGDAAGVISFTLIA